jgi:peptidyl-tRNA hydrolase, PTH1 family
MTIHLLIGLGNPGASYAKHRHNVGFMAVAEICDAYQFSKPQQKFGGALAEGKIAGERVFAFFPLRFMNCSGEPAGELARFYKIPLENITVFHDELDLPLAKIRVKTGGGHGGHNGLKSLDAHIGQGYKRVRIGIGHPGTKELVHGHVLSDFSKIERETMAPLLETLAKQLPLLIQGNAAAFASKVALDTQKE